MDAFVQLATLVFGFVVGFIFYERTKYRVGGVVAVPVLVTYSIGNPMLFPIFLISIITCFVVGSWIAQRTLIYGRRLLYVFLILSVIITSSMIFFIAGFYSHELLLITVGTIFPGILAYNLNREIFDRESALVSVTILGLNMLVVGLFAVLLMTWIG